MPDIIGIEDGYVFAARMGEGEVAGGAETAVAAAGMFKIVNAVGMGCRGFASYVGCRVVGAVIHDPVFPAAIVLREDRGYGLRKKSLTIEDRRED